MKNLDNNSNTLANNSKYKNIIFVNNIDELQGIKNNILKDDKYKFVAFFTYTNTYDNDKRIVDYTWDKDEFGDKIYNIWYKGQRLTRFIGVDESDDSKNSMNIGNNKKIKLSFDRESGLLSLNLLTPINNNS